MLNVLHNGASLLSRDVSSMNINVVKELDKAAQLFFWILPCIQISLAGNYIHAYVDLEMEL